MEGTTAVWTPANIVRLRSSLKLTRAQLADKLGVSYNSVMNWENNVVNPQQKYQDELDKLAVTCEANVQEQIENSKQDNKPVSEEDTVKSELVPERSDERTYFHRDQKDDQVISSSAVEADPVEAGFGVFGIGKDRVALIGYKAGKLLNANVIDIDQAKDLQEKLATVTGG